MSNTSRLIDADALKDNMFHYAPPEMVWDRGDIEHKINEMPTVAAIPVEWLREQCKVFDSMARGGHHSAWIIKALILQWQNEQEAR